MAKLTREIFHRYSSLSRTSLVLTLFTIVVAMVGVRFLTAVSSEGSQRQPYVLSVVLPDVFSTTQPLPESINLDLRKVALGERLFHDVRLSVNDSVSCASCHDLEHGGVDNRVHSIGINGAEGEINAPTVFNSGFNIAQFWDGRAVTLEDQIDGPVNNPKEMASNWPQVIAKLSIDSNYTKLFMAAYGSSSITPDVIKNAIATFERSLITPGARFDLYLKGNTAVLTEQERHGYDLFRSYGCSSCHQGVNLGGNMFEKMGLMGDYFADRGDITKADNGRFNVDHQPHSMHEFRVPSLRNVAQTAPYFHDGHAATLDQAVATMAQYQLGRHMPAEDIKAIVAFLNTLTGTYQGKPL